ncbi:FarB, partial [Penicillium chermesinum]
KYRQDHLQPLPRRDEPQNEEPEASALQPPRSESPVEESTNFDRIATATISGFPEWDINLLCSIPTPSPNSLSEESPPFPHYIKPLPGSTSLETLAILSSEGVFEFPPIDLVREYFKSYVRWMYPMCPVVDLNFCLEALTNPKSGKQISVLLFYAIMLAGAAFVDEAHYRALEFESRIAARRTFFARAQTLFHAKAEDDRYAIIEATVILGHWYEYDDSPEDTWFWSFVSFALAQSLKPEIFGDQSSDRHSPQEAKTLRHRKQIFWCAFCKLVQSSIGMRRTPHPLLKATNLPPLLLDDLTIDLVRQETLDALGGCDFMSNDHYVQLNNALHTRHTLLCLLLIEILFSFYNAGDSPDRITGRASRLKPSSPDFPTIQQFDAKLKDWLDKIPDWLASDLSGVTNDSDEHISGTLAVHIAYVRMFYYLTIITLHRMHAQVQKYPKNQGDSLDSVALSRYRADIAADSIARMIPLLEERDLIKYLPLSGVTSLLNTAMYTLQRSPTEDHFSQMLSLSNVESYAKVLISLTDVHLAANYSLSLLNFTLQRSEFDWCRPSLDFISAYLQTIEAPVPVQNSYSPSNLPDNSQS